MKCSRAVACFGDYNTLSRPLHAGLPFVVKVLHSNETELCPSADEQELSRNDLVVVHTRYGKDLARVLGTVSEEHAKQWGDEREFVRKATDADIEKYRQNLEQEENALNVCRELVEDHGLDMKLVSAHFLLEEPKLLFFFSAEGRVDFRNLVKDLVSHFRLRIELRQIGVRDESRVLGGTGVCGRPFCCQGLTDKLNPVSIKMAKLQNLSLNSMKISGPCGRLLCCLYYENQYYKEQRAQLPDEGTRISYDGTKFRITEVNVISHKIALEGEDGRYLTLPTSCLSYDSQAKAWRVCDYVGAGNGESSES
jgi:cell fate regulator YaaT (PSP1 superfamily)